MNGLSLCSGIGSLDLGIRLAEPSYRTVCHVEREAYAAAVLVKRMEEGRLDQAPIWDDLTTFDGRRWRGVVDIVTAGLPCQPYSVAGRQQGDKDERYIWPEFFRIVREVQPALVFLENVPGLLAWFRPIGEELCGMGYEFEAGLFSAAEVGASHKRLRLFILAHSQGRRCEQREPEAQPVREFSGGDKELGGTFPPGPADTEAWAAILQEWPELAPAVDDSQIRTMRKHGEDQGKNNRDGDAPDNTGPYMENPARIGSGGRRGRGVPNASDDLADGDQGGLSTEGASQQPARIERGGGSQEETQPAVRGMAHGPSERVDRLRACGNAVVPATAALAFEALLRIMGEGK